MQVVILGMHRSGTSLVSRLINMMGVYFGEQGDGIPTNSENPRGFWERKDIRVLNDFALHSMGNDWNKVSMFDLTTLGYHEGIEFDRRAFEIVDRLSSFSPILLKEPRMCLLLPKWKAVLDDPIFIHVFRNPLEVAASLNARNGMSILAGIALWEYYNIRALQAVSGERVVYISHEDVLSDPHQCVNSLYQQLSQLGVDVQLPSYDEVEDFVDFSLHRQKNKALIGDYLNSQQVELYELLGSLRGASEVAPKLVTNLCVSNVAMMTLSSYEECLHSNEALNEIANRLRVREQENHELQANIDSTVILLEQEIANKKRMLKLLTSFIADVDDLLVSKRWLVGDKVICFFRRISFMRVKPASFIDRVAKIKSQISQF